MGNNDSKFTKYNINAMEIIISFLIKSYIKLSLIDSFNYFTKESPPGEIKVW